MAEVWSILGWFGVETVHGIYKTLKTIIHSQSLVREMQDILYIVWPDVECSEKLLSGL